MTTAYETEFDHYNEASEQETDRLAGRRTYRPRRVPRSQRKKSRRRASFSHSHGSFSHRSNHHWGM